MSAAPIHLQRRGLMFVLSSPSGAGKSTLARLLLDGGRESQPVDLGHHAASGARARSTASTITSSTKPAFMRMREHGELLESAEVHGNFYGTPRAPVEKALAAGKDVLFDIDWQGTEQLSQP